MFSNIIKLLTLKNMDNISFISNEKNTSHLYDSGGTCPRGIVPRSIDFS